MKDTYGNYVEILDFIEKIQDDREEIKELYDQGEYFEAARKSKELFDFLKSEEAQENFKNMKKLYENGGINKDASDMTDAEIDQVLEGFFDFILD
jgi:proline dehydrogenase